MPAHDYHPPVNDVPLTAAQLQGARNRVTLSSDLMRRAATLAGYDRYPAFEDGHATSLTDVMDVGDVLELMLTAQLGQLEINPPGNRKQEGKLAAEVLRRIAQGDIVTRRQIHDELPPETVVLFRMGAPRLWSYSIDQRLPKDAHLAMSDKERGDPSEPITGPTTAWLGERVVDAVDLSSLPTQVPGIPWESDDSYRRLRLGMSLADDYLQVWSSARGHWSVSADTRYIVPSRFGYCPFVFKIPPGAWRRESFEHGRDRYIAERGYFIDLENEWLVELGEPDPNNQWLPTTRFADEAPTERDLQVARAVSEKIIAVGAGQKNPIIRLRQKGRRLF
ncbi:hypothetical protein L1O03_08515 [Corynebacterium uropygiale]|uniref:Uncharacterized protein n=1 Tax=Corynebacterium uropygiale TaxID=1775911 RepID=A0A9X1QUH8_9CORY|nr:hypothetical protein [Corynebacterium uropygiale]MCF4007215.1 hypothetical protein [Corynebacterium uropygiale]